MNSSSTSRRTSDSTVRTGERTSEPTSCPECGGSVAHDAERMELLCMSCGLVFEEERLDHGPEWRAFDPEEKAQRSRVGAPTTELLHDKGLSSTIGWRDADAYGNALSPRKRETMRRLRRWDERFRARSDRERTLKRGLGEITRMVSALGLSETTGETAGILFRRALEDDLLPGRSIEGVASASLYGAARQAGVPRGLDEVGVVSRVDTIRIQRAYRYLSRELGLEIAPADPAVYVGRFCSELDLSDEAKRVARELLDNAKAEGLISGKSPTCLAAAAVYAASHLTNEQVTQAAVSDVSHAARVTIRVRYRELLEAIERDQWRQDDG